ncbi:RHS repeat domain-containing protein [Ruminococcus sp. NK3A76]|uniref:RHS repeat domain-containing protein n=1 Tax=Ruminococcus sp. NK3A76 TaxID=877411 RepID=UPI00068F7A0D|nr:RHS repeat domain-containing protein [Ruminococcus sp. NK3A76]
MKKLSKKQITIGVGSIAAVLAGAIVVFANISASVDDNPWAHALLAGKTGGSIAAESNKITVNGDLRSNGKISIESDTVAVNGYAAAVSSVNADISEDNIYDNIDSVAFPNVYDNVYEIAGEYSVSENDAVSYSSDNLILPDMANSSEQLNINVSAETAPSADAGLSIGGKIGAFGAGFFAKTYSNHEKWNKIFPVLYKTENGETNSLVELGRNSNFIPLKEQGVGDSWSDCDELPNDAISNNFTETQLTEYISSLKTDNPVTSICSEGSVIIQANNTVNPESAEDAKKIVVEGGHFSLDGDYSSLEEIRFDSWGGSQLIGSYPNLKYIYKSSWSDLNLVGDFPSLECIYMVGGQLLLGSGDQGFSADGVRIINDYGPIAIYTAKDVNITNSEIVTSQMILMRGAGADKPGSVFNSENTIMAAKYGIMFEDMNDLNVRRYSKLPVYYSVYPMSVINCNFRLLQGTFVINNNAIIMTNANIDKFRGFMFSPEGIDEYRNSSAVGFYLNTYAYNISPNINNLNKQPNGSEEIGRISSFEYAEFPRELIDKISDSTVFLADLSDPDNEFEIGESNKKPGELSIGKFIFADGNISISADTLVDQDNSFTVIASKHGNITINVTDSADITAIIYAPNGKVTITGGAYNIKGRIFACDIEINTDTFEITSGDEDISNLGFTYDNNNINNSSDNESSNNSDSGEDDNIEDSSKTDSGDDHNYDDSSDADSNSDVSSDDNSSTDANDDSSNSSPDDSIDDSSSDTDDSSSVDHNHREGFTEPEYEYDLLNRLIKVTYDENNYIEYEYDANGNITEIVTVKDGEIQHLEDEE